MVALSPRIRRLLAAAPGTLGAVLALAGSGCSLVERTPAPPRSSRADLAPFMRTPQILQGTVASETLVEGFQPVIVHGYGLVVGLDGTGSSDVPPDVRAHILSMASRRGIGSESSGYGYLSPEALLDSPDTAVVVVEGVVPPGAVEGTRFDVRVFPHPTSSTTSLEGGRLYTTELVPAMRPDLGRRLMPPTGSRQPAALAEARGAVFINPFADPGAIGRDTIERNNGWILNGGVATKDMPLRLRLLTPSHSRASIIQNAINTRFSQEPGQRDPTARGDNDESIEIKVPPSYYDDTAAFVELVRHTTIRQSGAEQVAMSVRRYVLENPAASRAASWRWQALGPKVLPVIRDLYDDPQELPRLAALRAGANLDDPLVAEHLIAMARSGSPDSRREAIELLGAMGIDPSIDMALRRLLNDPDVETRLAAYEALVQRADPSVERFGIADKFVLDLVASDQHMIYITQLGVPRIAIFGPDLAVTRPVTVTAWSRHFMMKADEGDDLVEVYYRPPGLTQGSSHPVSPNVAELTRFLGHKTLADKPLPGLGFSYSQVVGVLHQIWRQGYLDADFKAEQDRILAAIIRQQRRAMVEERPEFSDEVEEELGDESVLDAEMGLPERPEG